MACMGSSELTEYDIDNKWGAQALGIFFKFVSGRNDIEDRYFPSTIRDDPEPEQKKKEFHEYLQKNLVLVDLCRYATT